MPPALKHRKSRNGCTCCKERKIKCDEVTPTCSACSRHGVKCVYNEIIRPRRRRVNSSQDVETRAYTAHRAVADSPAAPLGPDTPYSIDTLDVREDQRKQIELFLLSRFISVVSSTFPAAESEELRHIYSRDAVELSFQHGFLQNTILAISALYTALQQMSHDSVDPKPALLPPFIDVNFGQVHRVYLNLAIQQQRAALNTIDTRNADALVLASVMMSIVAARLLPESAPGAMPDAPYHPPMQSLYISEAIGAIVLVAAPYFMSNTPSPISKLLQQSEMDPSDIHSLYDLEEGEGFQHLLDFEDLSNVEEKDDRTIEAYTRAIALVGSIHATILRREPSHRICRRIMLFAPVVPKPFLHMLREMRPRALVIFAYYMSMVKRVERYWWLAGAAEREVNGILTVLPDIWKWAMDWPLEMISRLEHDWCARPEIAPTQLGRADSGDSRLSQR